MNSNNLPVQVKSCQKLSVAPKKYLLCGAVRSDVELIEHDFKGRWGLIHTSTSSTFNKDMLLHW